MELIDAHSKEHIADVRAIFKEYADWLGFDLCFQDFDRELTELPGHYAPPSGRLILATETDAIAGCVALRHLDGGICEMKRLYVRAEHRGKGTGRALATRVISEALKMGYELMRLDTLPSMTAAVAMYKSLGFAQTEAYRFNPIDGATYMELVL